MQTRRDETRRDALTLSCETSPNSYRAVQSVDNRRRSDARRSVTERLRSVHCRAQTDNCGRTTVLVMKTQLQHHNRTSQTGGTVTQLVPQALQQAYIDCHSEGHQWRHQGMIGGSDPSARPPFGAFDSVGRISMCASCGSERTRWYTRSGEAVNRYSYADGYTHKKAGPDDDPAPTRLEWRQRLVVQLFADMKAPKARKAAAS